MNNYQERVHREKEELDKKIEKLNLFFQGNIWLEMNVIDQGLLQEQLGAMSKYSFILEKRIERFK